MKRAKEGLEETRETFQGLTASLSEENISRWKGLAEDAMANRGDALKIYQVQQAKGFSLYLISLILMLTFGAVPSQAEIRLKLTQHEDDEDDSSLKFGAISWLAEGINLEGLQ